MVLKYLKSSFILNSIRHRARFKHSWIQPEGSHVNLQLYNCITRQKENFIPNNKDAVSWYTCGPTVYDSSHIGHAACYVRLDIIQRILREYFGINLVTCMNITDIDDKIIKKSKDTKTDYKTLVQQYENEFWQDLNSLQVPKPDIVVGVVKNMPLIIDFIKKLETNGVAYKGSDNSIYFDVSKAYSTYGKLQNIGDYLPESSNPHKKSPVDFALWKNIKDSEEPTFKSPWGFGRPGWHIECSTLASAVFGDKIDIHAGGIDLRFPHHENEEVQSCTFHRKKQWVNYWIHTGHLHLKGALKMSKSLKNTISIQQMLNDISANEFRILCAMSHYSHPMEYSNELLETPRNVLKVYENFINTCEDIENGHIKPTLDSNQLNAIISKSFQEVNRALCDNFNTPLAIQIFNQSINRLNAMIYSASTDRGIINNMYLLLAFKKFLCSMLNILGIELKQSSHQEHDDSTKVIDLLIRFRQEVRTVSLQEKNKELLTACDSVRDSLKEYGISVKDHGKVSSWSR
ncbi:hypothetical protein GWI33_004476 [Rhynchophorus ferrugineus]|uniref:cysteine--tRNA ligase n=1 Tax=Rhynchophorus ferrugineus TaxID=354439 RepID=A0A834IIK7_RHYFE|nr:hypothetical protein GWI33_004476 [Rhynchophorus ferrugineus]